jgi:transcriptional regulator with XRE-family HTH domain
MNQHWTAGTIQSYLSRLTFDFLGQVEQRLDSIPMSQRQLAKKLGVTEGAVSQTLNNTGGINLRQIVKYAQAVGMKVAIIAYDDNDPDNKRGPINSEIFGLCWEKMGKPIDMFDLNEAKDVANYFVTAGTDAHIQRENFGNNTDAGNRPIQETERKLRLVA